MDKKEYTAYINEEIYAGKKLTLSKKLYLKYANPSTNAVFLLRSFQYYISQKSRFYKYIGRRYGERLAKTYGIYLSPSTEIDMGLKFPHPTSIIIGSAVKIGKNCSIFQNVTLGSKRSGEAKLGLQPKIGDNVTLFAGAKLIGDITVGNGARVGANAVLDKDADEGGTYVGIPARKAEKCK